MIDYNQFINQNIASVKPSQIRRFFDIANEMEDVISLSVGEPDFSTPWHVRQAGIKSLEKGQTWYTPNSGFIRLREAIANYFNRRLNLSYNPTNEILVTVGGSEAIDLALRVTVGSGDEVIIPQPSFVCYEPITKMTGATPVIITTKQENEFKLTKEELLSKITPRTKVLILPFPNNPTGAIMNKQDLEEIAEVVEEHNLLVVSDEIYSELTYTTDRHISFAEIGNMKERTIIVTGFSKSYAMTGWRLGYALGPKELIKQMTKLHQYAIMSAPTTAQYAAIEALDNGDTDIERMRNDYNMRRRLLVSSLRDIGLECFEPKGAFYVFPNITKTGLSSEEFCERLLLQEHVAVIPGNAFGESGEGFIRISYSYSIKHLNEALCRIERFIKNLDKKR